MSVTIASKEDDVALKQIKYIYSLLYFRKNNENNVRILIDFNSKVNAITLVYTAKLSFKLYFTNVKAQKINSFILKIF